MKRTILKKWMMTLVIILFYFNNGIQATDTTETQIEITSVLLEKKEIEPVQEEDEITNETLNTGPQNGIKHFLLQISKERAEKAEATKQKAKTDTEIDMNNLNAGAQNASKNSLHSAMKGYMIKEKSKERTKFDSAFEDYEVDGKIKLKYSSVDDHDIPWPHQLKKWEHVLVQLENPCDDFIKTLFTFSNFPSPQSIDTEDKALGKYWTNEMIKQEIEEYIDYENENLRTNKEKKFKTVYVMLKEGPTGFDVEDGQITQMNNDAQQIPHYYTNGSSKIIKMGDDNVEDLLGQNYISEFVPVYNKYTKEGNDKDYEMQIKVQEDDDLQELLKLKSEYKLWTAEGMDIIIRVIPNIFNVGVVVYDINRKYKAFYKSNNTHRAFIYIIENGEKELYPVRKIDDLKNDFPNLFDGKNPYHINFSPISPKTFDKLGMEVLREDYQALLGAVRRYNPNNDYREKDLNTIALLKKMREKMKERSFTEYMKGYETKAINVSEVYYEKTFTNKYEVYGLCECFDLYIENDWKNLDDNTFNLIMENCRIYTKEQTKYAEKIKPQTIIEFFNYRYHGVKIGLDRIVREVKWHQKMIWYQCAATLVFVVIPCCSVWKADYYNNNNGEHNPELKVYDIKIAMKPLLLFALWSLYPFMGLQFANPFLHHDIKAVNEIVAPKTNQGCCGCSKKCRCSGPCWKKISDIWSNIRPYVFFDAIRRVIVNVFEEVEKMMVGSNIKKLLVMLFITDQIGNMMLNFLRDLYPELDVIIPPPMSIKYCIHKPLLTAKTFVLVFFGRTEGFGMANMFHATSGEFEDMISIFFLQKIPLLLFMIPTVLTAKLIKVTTIAIGYEIEKHRKLAWIVTWFKKYFHNKYDNRASGICPFYKNNVRVIIAKMFLVAVPFSLKYAFTDKDYQDDCGDITGIFAILFLWDIVVKPFKQIFYNDMVRSRNDHKECDWSIVSWSSFTALLTFGSWYTFGFEKSVYAMQYSFEFVFTVLGMWFFMIVIDTIYALFYNHVYKKMIKNQPRFRKLE